MTRVINVSNRLPIRVDQGFTKSSGGLVSALEGITGQYDLHWIGWAGHDVSTSQREEVVRRLHDEFGYVPVFLTDHEAEMYYSGFANASVWPLLHYMQTYAEYDDAWWDVYKTVNQRFADAVLADARDGDLVWVHDYHLMLVPSMLKRANATLKVGFFLHTPFPSYEIFRCHPRREALILGLLGADLIGFHTFGYLRHFRSTVLRLLGIETDIDRVIHDGLESRIGVYPIGINGPGFADMLASETFRDQLAKYDKLYHGKRLVLSVERMDYTKGIPHKIAAIERFLETHPDDRENTVFVIIAVPSRQGVDRYQELIEDVESAVGRINGQYSTVTNVPINFIHRGVPFHELCALYRRADAALVTPLMDGMNLVAKEFVACQGDDPGVLILSEFAGAAQELFNAWMVNPYDTHKVVEAIEQALAMDREERVKMIEPMKARVIEQDSVWWAKRFIGDLDAAKPGARQTSSVQTLNDDVAERFAPSDQRKALFLDYDGTLAEIVTNPAKAIPTQGLHRAIAALAARKDVDVYVVSGRHHEFLDQHLGHHPVTLIAEHGYMVREPDAPWRLFNDKVDLSWKAKLLPILELYAATTPGSTVEQKTSAIVWHYRKADPEFGRWKAGELIGELMESLSNLPVELHHGKKIVEVSSQQVNKGEAMRHYLATKTYSITLAAGDDQTDENMFAFRSRDVVTVKVGTGDTAAAYRVDSPARFRELLDAIAHSPHPSAPTETSN